MLTTVMAVALCLASSIAYAAAAVMQLRYAKHTVTQLLRDPVWGVAMALNGIASVLHVVALRYGPLSLVQPLGVLTLVFAAMVTRKSPNRAQRRAMLITVSGLTGLLLLTATDDHLVTLTIAQLIGLVVVTAVVLVVLRWHDAMPNASGLWAAGAGGISFGVSSALTQTVALQFGEDGFGSLLSAEPLLAMGSILALIPAGLLFTQRSYREGLGAPMAVATIVNPVSAAAIGLLLLNERIAAGVPGAVLAVVCAVGAAAGVSVLAKVQPEPPLSQMSPVAN